MFTIRAAHGTDGTLYSVQASYADQPTQEEADAITALFPKSLLARTTRCGHGSLRPDTFYTTFYADLRARRGNGVNEAGMKRYRSFRRICAKHNLAVDFTTFNNPGAYYTEAEFEAIVS